MKLLLLGALCLLICYIHVASSTASKSSATSKQADKSKKEKAKAAPKPNNGINAEKLKNKNKENNKNTHGSTQTKDKSKVHKRDANSQGKPGKTMNIRTPFDKTLDKLSNCAVSSPSLVDVMQENLQELETDEKYRSLFDAAPHTANFINKKTHDPTKFIGGLRQALNADWSNPAWKSYDDIDTIFRPLKQQFVYAIMRFNCT